jgi:hypothetical protein
MKDFTLDMYKVLIERLRGAGYSFQRLEDFAKKPLERVVIIRHDVDIWNRKALPFARLENELGVKASYYFRYLKTGFDPEVIREVASLGHEVGYHYEDLTTNNGDMEKAIESFEVKLSEIRECYPVKTMCMHGKSGSPYNNRDMWKKYDYKDYGIVSEPYLDLDYNQVLYLTDTTQKWNDDSVALRDRVESRYDFSFRTTSDILENIERLPDQILFNIHPDIWARNFGEWVFLRLFVGFHSLYKVHYRNKRVMRRANSY